MGPDDFIIERKLPEPNADLVMLCADRYLRATNAHELWAEPAKRCVEFVEGKQWSFEDQLKLENEDRPGLTFNKVAPLVRLVLGYHRNNRTDIKYLSGSDGTGIDEVAESLTHYGKQISEDSHEPYVNTEVFMDGLIAGRGYYDWRMDFSQNDLGEARCKAKDPFSIKLDPDGDTYDINDSCNFTTEERWVSLQEVESAYGIDAADMLSPYLMGAQTGMAATNLVDLSFYARPWTTFGGRLEGTQFAMMTDFLPVIFDRFRKAVLLLDFQHYVWTQRNFFIDLETGQRRAIPDHWDRERISRALQFVAAKAQAAGRPNTLRVQKRHEKRVRWTTLCGDLLVYDDWSLYNSFTLTGFFPYFRRGQTRGMVHDLLDPQMELNKRRSAQVDIVTRSANGGWKYHSKSMTPDQKQELLEHGAAPGFNMEWDGEQWMEPKRIEPGVPPMAMERLEIRSADDLKEISGINDSLLGIIDRVQSGVAITARQRQGVVSIQLYLDNMGRTQELCGVKKLDLMQNFYTEERLVRRRGEGSGKPKQIVINKRMADGTIANDVTMGTYNIAIDETPLAATFAEEQFQQLLDAVEKKVLPAEAVMDVAVQVSHLPEKETLKKRVTKIMAKMGVLADGEEGAPPPPPPPTGQKLVKVQWGAPKILGPDGKPLMVTQDAILEEPVDEIAPDAGGGQPGQGSPGSIVPPGGNGRVPTPAMSRAGSLVDAQGHPIQPAPVRGALVRR